VVWRTKLSVVGKEESRRNLRTNGNSGIMVAEIS